MTIGDIFRFIVDPWHTARDGQGGVPGAMAPTVSPPSVKIVPALTPSPGTQQAVQGAVQQEAASATEKAGQVLADRLGIDAKKGGSDLIHEFWVWGVIIIVGIIGLWGLVAPGGGVAIIERKVSGR